MVVCVSEGRAQTGRSKDFPAGDIRCLAVEAANKQVIALVVCLLVAWLRDVRTAAENPSSTLLHLLRPFDLWLKFVCKGPSAVRMLENIKQTFGACSFTSVNFWIVSESCFRFCSMAISTTLTSFVQHGVQRCTTRSATMLVPRFVCKNALLLSE